MKTEEQVRELAQLIPDGSAYWAGVEDALRWVAGLRANGPLRGMVERLAGGER